MIQTTIVGSYPQPDWLVDKTRFRQTVVPRIRMPDLWRVPAAHLAEAHDDTHLDQLERALDGRP